MHTSARRQKQSRPASSNNFTSLNAQAPAATHPAGHILHLQRTMGNQVVLRLLQEQGKLVLGSAQAPIAIQPKLTLNAGGDIYEQEAERVSEHVMRMPGQQPLHACA